jgi:hypothetical protein
MTYMNEPVADVEVDDWRVEVVKGSVARGM